MVKDLQFGAIGTLGALSTSNAGIYVGIPYNQGASSNGKLQVASATFSRDSTVQFAINAGSATPGVDSGEITSSGPIDLGGVGLRPNFNPNFKADGECPPVGATYTLISTTGTLSGSASADGLASADRGFFNCGPSFQTFLSYRLQYNRAGSPQTLTATVEPTTGPSAGLRPVTPPKVTGVALVGETLTATHGTWNPAPTAYSDQWVRCSTTSFASCSAIAGATTLSYRLTAADVGKRIQLREVPAQPGPAQLSAMTAVVQALPTATQIKRALRKIGAPASTASIRSVLAKGATLTFTAPSAGRLSVAWYQVPAGARVTAAAKAKKHLVVVAQGTRTATRSGKVKLVVRLTAAGRHLLRATQKAKRSIRLTSKASFTPKGGKRVTRIARFRLKR